VAEAPAPVRFTVLGPVRAWRAGVEVDLGPPQQKAALAVLLVRAGQPVGLSEIVDVLWRDDPPASAVNVVHGYVGKLRRLLEPDLPVRAPGRWLVRGAGGYRLEIGSDTDRGSAADVVDLLQFRRLCKQARRASRDGPSTEAVTLLLAAVGLWHGPCAAGTVPEVRAHPMFTAVDREHVAAVQDLADAALGSGVPERVVPTVRQAASRDAWDEPLQARLVLVLAAFAANRLLYPHRDPITLPPSTAGVTTVAPTSDESARAWFAAEYAVLLAMVRQAATSGFEGHAWELTWTLQEFFDRGGHWRDWVTTQRLALETARARSDQVGMAYTHVGMGILNSRRDRTGDARRELERALDLFGQLGNVVEQAHVHLVLGSVAAREDGRQEAALRHERQAFHLYQAAGHRIGEAWALNNLGYISAQMLDDYSLALDYCQRALVVHQELGDRQGEANAWDSVGYAHAHLGHYEQAVACYQRAVELHGDLGDRYYRATSLAKLGDAHHDAGNDEQARNAWQQALATLLDLDHPAAADVHARLQDLDLAGDRGPAAAPSTS
jgi:DNA-binding SARP family transcriptional activator